MKILRKKQQNDLETALNLLYSVGWDLTNDQDGRLVEDALTELKVALDLISRIVNPMK